MSVDVAEFPPGVTEVGDRAQVAVGVDPITPQESCTALPKDPFCGVMVMTSVTCPPRGTVKLADAGLSEKSGGR